MNQLTHREQAKIRLDFRNKIIGHQKLKEALNELNLISPEADGEKVILLVGPTGVGKDVLLEAHKKHLSEVYAEEMKSNPGFVPYIFINAMAGIDGIFNWKDAFTRMLGEFNEILIKKKVIPFPQVELDGMVVNNIRTLVREELRRGLSKCVKNRGTRHIFINEAAHMLRLKRGLMPRYQYEVLRSLAIELSIPLCLSGSYELLGILDEDGQLNRRIEFIHLARYLNLDISDLDKGYGQSFSNSIYTLLDAMPIPREDGLHEHVDYFFMKSLGCIGILKTWLMRALKYSLDGDGVLTRQILEMTAKPNKELKKILKEAEWGEEKLRDLPDEDLARALNMKTTPNLSLFSDSVVGRDESLTRNAKTSKRIGRRGPSRDPVGGVSYAD